ncbi:uncharacterized protein LOC131209630 [Anopheles bellator]|uniref:uncharacterized protein LOC131209630 n=1 Tax=Anopheles bellator TaxID=139047 RepID=UPI002648A29F|nr:uncharacterized protein LOC131209630 [Anopheles bellator]
MKSSALLVCALLMALGTVIAGAEDTSLEIAERDNKLNKAVIEFLENLQKSMPCGIPDMGIPVLAPFELDHMEFDVVQKGLKFKTEFNDMVVDGLDDFEIRKIDVKVLKLQLDFEFFFNSIRTKGKYQVKGKTLGFVPFQRSGPFKFNVNGITLKGTVKVALKGDSLQIRDLRITTTIESVNSKLKNVFHSRLLTLAFNRMVEGAVPGIVNDNQVAITDTIESSVKPALNEVLSEISLQDLIDAASGEGSSLPVTC